MTVRGFFFQLQISYVGKEVPFWSSLIWYEPTTLFSTSLRAQSWIYSILEIFKTFRHLEKKQKQFSMTSSVRLSSSNLVPRVFVPLSSGRKTSDSGKLWSESSKMSDFRLNSPSPMLRVQCHVGVCFTSGHVYCLKKSTRIANLPDLSSVARFFKLAQ